MPLLKGNAKGIVGANIQELMKTGRSQPQAVAISLQTAGKSKKPKKAKAPAAPDYDSEAC